MRGRWLLIAAAAAAAIASCTTPAFERRSLSPGANPFGPSDPLFSRQPSRAHPDALAATPDGRKLYVTLSGSEDEPGTEVAVLDVATEAVLRRVTVGSSPAGLAVHPSGRFVVVTNRYSNFASVIDTRTDRVALEVRVPFYTVDVAFTPDGKRAFLANRWKDSVLFWDLDVGESFRVVGDDYATLPDDAPMGIPVGDNPRDLAMAPDGSRLWVASPTGLSVSIVDPRAAREVRRVRVGSPPGGIALAGKWAIVSHTGRGSQHQPDFGTDGDDDGRPGDGTANVMFQDLQNELSVFDANGDEVRAYTSDTICCKDFRDVDPDHPEKGAALPAPDPWPASRLAFLPPRATWIVAGALPERMAFAGGVLWVAFSGSNEVQGFTVGEDGSLEPRQRAGGLVRTGMNPTRVAIAGGKAWVSERLGERLTVFDPERGPGSERRVLVGDESGGAFPATDAEIGEAINFVTAPLTVDGDQTCVHCHREGGNIAKPIAMPLQASFAFGTRMVMAYRGAADTRPWFFETAMTETNFFPVVNEFDRKENYCCEGLDPLVWSKYPSFDACAAQPSLAGCNHVLRCTDDPPPECATRTYGSVHLTRNRAFLEGARALLGRDHTFGDALYAETLAPDGTKTRAGLALDFNGVTRSLGLFLLTRPRFFPNPNAAIDLAAARRGRDLYTSPAVGCNTCHPLPLTTVTRDFNPSGVPLRFPPVISPRRDPGGADVDRVTGGFLQTFPDAQQDAGGIRFGVPQLRGIWDRARRFFHDGRARTLREALATPNHPALAPGEVGHNETNGMPDTHGATSQLTPEELDALVTFLLTL